MPAITSAQTLIIFTASPTGLGHIRAMDALREGLIPGSTYTEVGIEDVQAQKIHALGSRIPALTKLTEFYQTNPLAESIAAGLFTFFLHRVEPSLIQKFASIHERYPYKKRWIIVSTHFALAHSISIVKDALEKKFDKQVYLCVVVTDDSPQRIWAVPNADLIFVPSNTTKESLEKFLPEKDKGALRVASFPISPKLAQKLAPEDFQRIQFQLDPNLKTPLHIEIPISGAAVQLPYLGGLVRSMAWQTGFVFTVIGQDTPYTKEFFEGIKKIPRVQISVGADARRTVDLYESLFYQPNRPAVEITKPSEQAFKAILKPHERGGVILLLTAPIGRQEKDNLNFLIRHALLPNDQEQKELERLLLKVGEIPDDQKSDWHYKASHWRAIRIPDSPQDASVFIRKLKEEGILFTMLSFVAEPKADLTSDGVTMIWNEIAKMIQ